MNQLEFPPLNMADDEKIYIKKYRQMVSPKEDHDLIEKLSDQTLNFAFFKFNPPSYRPLQCPPRFPHTSAFSTRFVGRQRELSELLDALKPAHVVTLCGPAGIGKSALAAEAISRLTLNNSPPELFPDGIIYHDFSQEPQVTEAMSHIARSFGDNPQRGTPATAAQRALAGRQALLVLDSTEKADDLAALLAVRGRCGVLMTSRQHKDALAKRLDLSPLQIDEAVELLLDCLKSNPFIPRNMVLAQKRARAICDLLGGWPFALCLAARDLQKVDVDDYLKRLRQNILDTLDQEPSHSVPRLLAQSVEPLSPKAQEALAVVGMLADAPFNQEVVAKVLDIPVYTAGRFLGELVNNGLLVRKKKQYEVTHRLIHTYAESRLPLSDEHRSKFMERFIDYYFHLVQESLTKENALAAIEAEYPHLLKALQAVRAI